MVFMNIIREDSSEILKVKRNIYDKYNFFKMLLAKFYLRRVIKKVIVNDFLFLNDLDKVSRLSLKSYADVFENYDFLRSYNSCGYICDKLKPYLESLNWHPYFVSCRANGFSTAVGDDYIKEAHIFLVCAFKRKKGICYYVFDPGIRLWHVLKFYDGCDSNNCRYAGGKIKVYKNADNLYPYVMVSDHMMDRNFNNLANEMRLCFNPYYEVCDHFNFDKKCFMVKHSYKLMDYRKKICIGLNILNGNLTINYGHVFKRYDLADVLNFSLEEKYDLFWPLFKKMKMDEDDLFIFFNSLNVICLWLKSGAFKLK